MLSTIYLTQELSPQAVLLRKVLYFFSFVAWGWQKTCP